MKDDEYNSFNQVLGVRASAVASGLKKNSKLDLALIEFASSSVFSAVFTQSHFAAAPVLVAKEHLKKRISRYCLINSGNANAATGLEGERDALRCCEALAEIAGVKKEAIIPFSTGVIGEPLDVDKIRAALPDLFEGLHKKNWLPLSAAIMTTDTKIKIASCKFNISGSEVNITGVAKGSGMIQPNMATMLSFVATDALVDQKILDEILFEVSARTFNRITIDGDTSTNDASVLVSTGISEVDCNEGPGLVELKQGITLVMRDLAHAIVKDGEGATKFVEVRVTGGNKREDCLSVAYSIANSPLVKTALFANDPNWGRLVMAIGKAEGKIDSSIVDIFVNDVCLMSVGQRDQSYTEEKGAREMRKGSIVIRVNLNLGEYEETVWTTDLSYEYVKINSEYRT